MQLCFYRRPTLVFAFFNQKKSKRIFAYIYIYIVCNYFFALCHFNLLWNSPGKNIGVGSIPFSRVSNPGLLHCRQILYCLSHEGSPKSVISSVQFNSVAQSCPTLCKPMNRSTDLPILHQLPEFTKTHVHQVGDAIQPSHPLLSPFPPAPNPSQHQSLFE